MYLTLKGQFWIHMIEILAVAQTIYIIKTLPNPILCRWVWSFSLGGGWGVEEYVHSAVGVG